MTTDTIQYIALADISPDPGNNRAELGDIDGLAASIKSAGLQQLIKLRPASDDDGVDTPWVITYGHRRFAALQALGTVSHDFIIGGNGVQSKLAQVVENVQREDLTPFEEGDAYASLAAQYGMKQAQIAEAVGKDAGTVSKRLTIAKLSTEARAALERCELTDGERLLAVARTCAKVPDEVWATIKKPTQLNNLENAQLREARFKKVAAAVRKMAKAAGNGRPIIFGAYHTDEEVLDQIPEKNGKVMQLDRQTNDDVTWQVPFDEIDRLPIDEKTGVVTFNGHSLACFEITYKSEADIEARKAELADENVRREAERDAERKARDAAVSQLESLLMGQPRAEALATILAESLEALTVPNQWTPNFGMERMARLAGVEPVMVPVAEEAYGEDNDVTEGFVQAVDENGELVFEIDRDATAVEILASKKGTQAIATGLALSNVTSSRWVSRTKGETTKAFKELDADKFVNCPLYQAWVAGDIEFVTVSL